MSFKGTGLVVAFLPVYALRQGTRRYMAEKFILTRTHTHEMSYEMLPQQVQERLTQKSCNRLMNFCTGSIPWSKSLANPSVLANIRRPMMMETVQFCHLEKLEKIGRKLGENIGKIYGTFWFHHPFFCSGLKLYKRFRWSAIYS